MLKEAREYPIIPLIDYIRCKLMSWFATRRTTANKKEDVLTPGIPGIVTNNFELTGGYDVTQIAESEYEIRNKNGNNYNVDLAALTCSSFEFQMLAIPCSHAIAAALKAEVNVDTLVTEYFKVSVLRSAYEGVISPSAINTSETEIKTLLAGQRLCPLATRRPPGRQKKHRFFSRGEKLVSYAL